MAFKLRKCSGPDNLPLIEVPDGEYFYERLSPGTIREPDYYGLFRKVQRAGAEVLVACPKSKIKRKRCQTALRVIRVRHPKKDLKKILSECRSGRLSRRRAREIQAILKDVGLGSLDGGNLISSSFLISIAILGIISIVIER